MEQICYKRGNLIILKERISAVITTSPPYFSQRIGLKLKQIFPGIIWISDFRDAESISTYNSFILHVYQEVLTNGMKKEF